MGKIKVDDMFLSEELHMNLSKVALVLNENAVPFGRQACITTFEEAGLVTFTIRWNGEPLKSEKGIPGYKLITEDLCVMDYAYTLRKNHINYFVPEMIVYGMTGYTENNDMEDLVGWVESIISRLALMDMEMSFYVDGKRKEISGRLLPVEKMTLVNSKGEEVQGYHLLEAPVLCRYAETVGEMDTIPTELLRVPGL